MDKKICSHCHEEKNLEDFSFKNKKTGKRSCNCRACQKKWKDEHYRNNKQYYLDRNRQDKIKKKEWWKELKSQLQCEKCGEKHIATLDFHHIDPNKKDFSIGRKYDWYGKKRLLEEIGKCKVLCSNCHRILHWEENNLP